MVAFSSLFAADRQELLGIRLDWRSPWWAGFSVAKSRTIDLPATGPRFLALEAGLRSVSFRNPEAETEERRGEVRQVGARSGLFLSLCNGMEDVDGHPRQKTPRLLVFCPEADKRSTWPEGSWQVGGFRGDFKKRG